MLLMIGLMVIAFILLCKFKPTHLVGILIRIVIDVCICLVLGPFGIIWAIIVICTTYRKLIFGRKEVI